MEPISIPCRGLPWLLSTWTASFQMFWNHFQGGHVVAFWKSEDVPASLNMWLLRFRKRSLVLRVNYPQWSPTTNPYLTLSPGGTIREIGTMDIRRRHSEAERPALWKSVDSSIIYNFVITQELENRSQSGTMSSNFCWSSWNWLWGMTV